MPLAYDKLLKLFRNSEVRNSFVYLFSAIAGSGVAFILVPILTRYLTPFDYGIVANYNALFVLINYFVMLGSSGYILRNYFVLSKKENVVTNNNVLFLNIILAVSISFVLYLVSPIVETYLNVPVSWLMFIPLISISRTFIDTNLTLLQARKKAKIYSVVQLSHSTLNLGLSVFLVTVLLWNWQGRIFALLISTLTLAIISLVMLKKDGLINFKRITIKKNNIRDFLSFGVPLIPHSIGGFILMLSDRFFISGMIDVSAAGLYSVGFTFGGLLMILHGAFYKVFVPHAFEKLSEAKDLYQTQIKLVRITYVYLITFIALSLGLYFAAKLIFPFFVGEKFVSAYEYVLWISLGYAMLSSYQMFNIYVIYTKQTKLVAFRTDFLAAAVKLPLTYILILSVGAIGAAQATFISYLITAISAWHINNKAYPMPWFRFKEVFAR